MLMCGNKTGLSLTKKIKTELNLANYNVKIEQLETTISK